MAEETNVPNDGVDELSQKSEFIAPASIGANLYKPLTPPVFDVRSLNAKAEVSNPALRIKDSSVGSAPNYPRAVDSNTKKYNKAAGLFDNAIAQIDANVDKNAYNKLYGFDSSPKGAHKARYKAYGQETYDKIGFSPEIDNETWFNANTTMYDDWKRMATQAAWPMMKLGFMSPIKSYGKLMGGADIGQDIAEARDYEEYNAIGMSTKGGVGGFMINLQNSAAYSVGILAEGVVEGMLIGATVGAIGGEGIGAAPGAVVGGVVEGFEALLKLPANLINMSKNLGKMTMNLKKLQNISEVRNVMSKAGRAMGDFINPLSNTSEAAMKYVFNNPDDLSNLARTARTVGSMWHDVKNLNLALSEGRLEGGFTENRVYEELYNDYYSKYNEAPNEELQKQMRKQAKVAGFQNTWKNTLLVHYSNQIAFPSITKAKFAKGLPKFSETIGRVGAEYKLVFNPGKTVAEGLYDVEKISLKNTAKSLTKPSTWGKHSLQYFKANFVEGFQESAQDVLSNATEQYYIDSFKNKDRQNFDYSMAALNAAMKKQISAQGLETFASGFAMGSILGIPGGVKDFLSVGYNKYYKHRADYDQYIKERNAEAEELKDALNTMHKNGQYFFDPRMNNYTTQMLVGKVADQPEGQSTKESKDASFAGFFSAVQTALNTGTFDTFLKNFEGYKQATPEEIEDAWRLEPGQGEKALMDIDKAVNNAKVIAQNYDYVRKKLKPLVNPNDFAENSPERELANIYNDAYREGINSLIFMNAAFTNNAERLNSMYSKLAAIPTLQGSRFADVSVLTEPDRLKKEIAMLRTEVKLGEQALTPEAKEQYIKQKDLLEKLESYQKEQSGATVEFVKKLIKAGTEIAKTETGLTPDEIRAKAVEQVTTEYEQAGLDPFVNYKNSFKEVLNSIAGTDEKITNLDREIDKAGGLDDIFETLMDTHALRNENMNLNKFINLLNNPKDFYEHVQRNFEWMQKLYNNRQEYYEDVINNSITNIQRNTLLEELANEGIYVDLEEFAKWCEDKTLPSYLIDQVNKRIINQDSYLYEKYIEKFEMAADAELKPPVPKSDAESKLESNIKDLNEKRAGELEVVKNVYDRDLKEVIGYTQEEIDEQRNEADFDAEMSADEVIEQTDLVQKALEQLNSSNPIEIQAVVDTVIEEELLEANEVNLAKEDIYSNEEAVNQIAAESEMFTDLEEDEAFDTALNAFVFKDLLAKKLETLKNFDANPDAGIPAYEDTKPYADYNTSVDEINKKYDDLIAKLTAEFEETKRKDVESNRPEEMRKSIQEVKDIFEGKGDVVQTKRNYLVDGKPHERMSNRIKSGYDTYTYAGAEELSEIFDRTIGAALAGEGIQTSNIEAQKADVEKRRQEELKENNFRIKDKIEVWEYTNYDGEREQIQIIYYADGTKEGRALDENGKILDTLFKGYQQEVPLDKLLPFEDFTLISTEANPTTAIADRINAKYDAELAALEGGVTGDIEAKKAEIERRRQEELISAVTSPITYEEFVNTKPSRIIVNNSDVYEYDKDLKKYVIRGVASSTNTNLESIAAREKNAKDIEFFKDKSLKLDEVNLFWTERIAGRNPITKLTNYKELTNQGRIDERIGDKLVEINAEYDAELAALEKSANVEAQKAKGLPKGYSATSLFNLNNRLRIIMQLFDGSSSLYQEEVSKINKVKSLDELRNLFNTWSNEYGWGNLDKDGKEVYDIFNTTIFNDVSELLPKSVESTDIEAKKTKVISSETVEKGSRKGETRIVTQTNYTEDLESTVVSITEYEAKVGDTTITQGGRRMTFKEFKEEFPLDEDYEEILRDWPDLNDDTIITVRKVKRTPSSSRFNTVVSIFSPVLGDKMDVSIQKDDAKYNAELASLKEPASQQPAGPTQLDQAMIDDFISALEESNLPGVNTNKFTVPIVRDELETLIAPEGTRLTQKTQNNIAKLEKQIAEIDTKLASVKNKEREALLNNQKKALEKAIEDEKTGKYSEKFEMTPDNLKAFVSNTVKENAFQESRDGGDLIDPMLKAYLDTETSTKPEFNPDAMSKEAYDALFDEETGYLTKFKKMADAGEIYIFTKDLIVHSDNLVDSEGNKLLPVAGEIDMIIVDRKGNKFIVDLKTGKTDKWMFYNIMNSKSYEKKLENTLQQTGYANLAQNMSGEEFGIKIFPLEVAYDKNGKLITAGAPTNPVLFADEEVIGDEGTEPYTITLDKNAVIRAKNPVTKGYEDISIANLMQRLVPNMAVKPKATSKSKPVNKMVPEEEQDFVDDFVKNLEGVNDFDALTEVFAELDKAKPRLSATTYKMLKGLLDSQASKMFEEDTNIDIKTGEIYIFTQPVKSQKIPQGYRVIVDSFNPETGEVELSRVGPGRKKSFTMDVKEFTSIAMSEEMINQGPKADEQYEPNEEEVQHIADSIAVTGDELSDFAQLAKWNDEASADDITPDQLKNDFFKNFKC